MVDYYPSSEIDDLGEIMMNNTSKGGSSTLGSFMELLGFQHFNNSTPNFFPIFNHHNHNHNHDHDHHDRGSYPIKDKLAFIDNYQRQQQPMTPNCSTISSESKNDDYRTIPMNDTSDQQQQQQRNMTNKQELKVKKCCDKKKMKGRQQQEKNKEARVAFMTRSEVDHLEDGFRWRKYGQKPVKNSPFPRSYYRCTNLSCNVKKRVERSLNDPTVVITTYEGKHAHPCPALMHHHAPTTFSAATFTPLPQIPLPHNHHQYYYSNFATSHVQNNDMLVGTALDQGLLQDIVPYLVKKE